MEILFISHIIHLLNIKGSIRSWAHEMIIGLKICYAIPVEGDLPFGRIWVLLTGSGLAERLSRQTV